MAGAIISQVSCHWGTPKYLLDGVRHTFGGDICLDPCGNAYSVVNARTQVWLPDEADQYQNYNIKIPCPGLPNCEEIDIPGEQHHQHWQRTTRPLVPGVVVGDGLTYDWSKHTNVYCNPPYGRDTARGTSIKDWILKCAQTGKTAPTMTLIPAAVGTSHWQDVIFNTADAICLLRGRVKFLLPGKDNVSTTPSAMVLWAGNGKYGLSEPSHRLCERFEQYFAKLGKII